MPDKPKLAQSGPTIDMLFANTVRDIRKGIMPLRMSAAIDLKVSFSAVEVNSNGWSLIYVKQKESRSTLTMELATRIHTDGLVPPTVGELVAFVQKQLIAAGKYAGPADGKRTDALDLAIEKEIQRYATTATGNVKERLLSWKGKPKPSFIGLLQILLKLPDTSWDGFYGPNTEDAFITRGTDYSLSEF